MVCGAPEFSRSLGALKTTLTKRALGRLKGGRGLVIRADPFPASFSCWNGRPSQKKRSVGQGGSTIVRFFFFLLFASYRLGRNLLVAAALLPFLPSLPRQRSWSLLCIFFLLSHTSYRLRFFVRKPTIRAVFVAVLLPARQLNHYLEAGSAACAVIQDYSDSLTR